MYECSPLGVIVVLPYLLRVLVYPALTSMRTTVQVDTLIRHAYAEALSAALNRHGLHLTAVGVVLVSRTKSQEVFLFESLRYFGSLKCTLCNASHNDITFGFSIMPRRIAGDLEGKGGFFQAIDIILS